MVTRLKFKGGPRTTDKTVAELIAMGYRRTSNAYGLVTRIDRDDWLEVLAVAMRRAPADFILRDGTGRVSPRWEDYYRRTLSKDTHTVLAHEIGEFPAS